MAFSGKEVEGISPQGGIGELSGDPTPEQQKLRACGCKEAAGNFTYSAKPIRIK
jgi:hypothetical protein